MLNLHNGKAQSSLIILVVLVIIFSILLVLTFFRTETFRSQVIKDIQLSRVSKYLDVTKGFSRHSSLLASHAACYDIAYKGGHIPEGTRTWVCNGPWAPAVDEVRFFLGKETLEFLNRYIENYDVEDPLIQLNNFTCVNYDVSESSVLAGKNDEKFDVGAFGSKINVTLEEDYATGKNEFDTEVERVRFWYMYRIFRKWAETTSLPQDICNGLGIICGCNPSLGYCRNNCQAFERYSLEQIEKARKYLESLFNDPEYIKCTAVMDCCMTQITKNTDSREMCLTWIEFPCGGCNREEPGTLCIKSILNEEKPEARPIEIEGKTDVDKTRFLQFNVGVTIAWKAPCLCKKHMEDHVDECGNVDIISSEPRGTITATFSCIDKKYSLSI